MIKLRTIVNEVLLKEEEQITWGEVSKLFEAEKLPLFEIGKFELKKEFSIIIE